VETLLEPAYVLPRLCSRQRYPADCVALGSIRLSLAVLTAPGSSWVHCRVSAGSPLGFLEDT
jgi:hypothetical protein